MKGLNKVVLIGNAAKDPVTNHVTSGDIVSRFPLAVEDQWTSNGERKTSTNFVPVTVWGKLAEKVIGEYVHVGSRLAVYGKLKTYKYERDGETKFGFEIVADEVVLLDAKPNSKSKPKSDSKTKTEPRTESAAGRGTEITDDDIPF